MKTPCQFACAFLITALLSLPPRPASAQNDDAALDAVRSAVQADRQAVVTESLQLTPAEAGKFWPLYHQYRAEMDTVGDGLLKLVKEYAGHYPSVPVERAKPMLEELLALEKQQVATRAKYLKKFGKVLPADKTLRFAQVENRLDLAVKAQVAAGIPLVPIEGRLTGEGTRAVVAVEGEPGGAVVQTYELTATVAAIDAAARKVTLVSPDGIKQTVKVGPEAINFDQIRVGDTLKVEVTEELVVHLAGPGDATDSAAAAVVALAPKGAKPGGVMAETTRVSATVSALDPQQHTATLRFEDGTTQTFPVRRDVDLGQRQVGEKVIFRVTERVALRVEKP